MCKNKQPFLTKEKWFECPVCGNHVCAQSLKKSGKLCPHCFALLVPIS